MSAMLLLYHPMVARHYKHGAAVLTCTTHYHPYRYHVCADDITHTC